MASAVPGVTQQRYSVIFSKCRYVAVVSLIIFTAFIGKANAQSSYILLPSAEIDTTYTLGDKGDIEVTHNVIVDNSTSGVAPEDIELTVIGSNLEVIESSYQDNIPLSLKAREGALFFEVSDQFAGPQTQWSFSVTYTSNMKNSNLSDIYYLPQLEIANTNITRDFFTLLTSDRLGRADFIGLQPQSVNRIAGSNSYSFKVDQQDVARGVLVAFKNSFARVSRTGDASIESDILLPADSYGDTIYLDSPGGRATSLDGDLNLIIPATYLPDRIILLSVLLQTDFSQAAAELSNQDSIGLADYLSLEGDISSSGLLEDSVGASDYQKVVNLAKRTSSLEPSLQNANKIAATLRSMGVPTKTVVGQSALAGGQLQDYYWLEVYLGNLGWLELDVFLYDKLDSFGQNNPLLIPQKIIGLESISKHSDEVLGSPSTEESVSNLDLTKFLDGDFDIDATKMVIVPFLVSILDIDIVSASGQTSYNNAIRVGGQVSYIDALAPASSKSLRKLILGSGESSVDYGIFQNDEFTQIESVEAGYNYTLFIIIIFGMVAIALSVTLIRNKNSSHKISPNPSSNAKFIHPNHRS